MRYGEFIAKHKVRHTELSYNLLTPKPDPSGEKSLRPAQIQITPSRAAALFDEVKRSFLTCDSSKDVPSSNRELTDGLISARISESEDTWSRKLDAVSTILHSE